MPIRSLETLARRAKVARWSLVSFFALYALQIACSIAVMWLGLSSMVVLAINGGLGLASYIALLVFLVAYLMWLHRASRNLGESGNGGMRFSSGWHVGSYFVPLANLFVPFLAMRELWNRSHGEEPELADSSVSAVTSWWACWVAAILILTFLFAKMFVGVLTNVSVVNPLLLDGIMLGLALVLLLGASGFIFVIIGAITRAQSGLIDIGATFE